MSENEIWVLKKRPISAKEPCFSFVYINLAILLFITCRMCGFNILNSDFTTFLLFLKMRKGAEKHPWLIV